MTFWALTTGNEPLNGIFPVNRFNSMGWTPMSHREWIGDHMGPRLKASEHNNTLLFAIDDQRIVLPWWMKMVSETYYNNTIDAAGLTETEHKPESTEVVHTNFVLLCKLCLTT